MSRSAALPHLLALVLVAALLPFAAPARAQQAPQVKADSWQLSDVADWEAGASSGLLITNNAGGELRLAEDQVAGAFLSAPFATAFAFNAAGAVWHADLIEGTGVRLELRARATPPPPAGGNPDDGWGAWQPLESGDARSQADDGALATADVLAFPADSAYLQLRASLTSQVARASATLSAVTVSYLRTAQPTPTLAAGLPRRPILSGRETLTQRPVLIGRSDWSGTVAAAQPARRDPRGIIIHQIAADPSESSLDLMRALLAYQTDVLGWDDLAYHYVIDAGGNLYEGRLGGPTSDVGRLSGGDVTIHIALVAPQGAAPSAEAQGALIGLLAWLGQAYDIAPAGQHIVLVGDARAQRPNIAAHSEADPAAADPAQATLALLPQIRSLADQSTVRARWYFAEGNVADYSERLSFLNLSGAQADAKVTLIPPGEPPLTRIVGVPAGARSDLVLNDVISGTTSLPAIVESSAPLLAERSMNLTTDVDGGPGISRLSRIWYFAEGSTEGTNSTYLILFNPQAAAVSATITYMRSDGTQFEQKVQISARDRLVVAVHDVLPDASFGARVIAAQPIAVERTMRFGRSPEGAAPGLHTGRGIDTLSRRWLFAEGTTENGFQMRLLVLNPNDQPANTEAVFMGPDGASDVRRYAIPPRSQLVINVNDVVPDLGVSTEVTADRPVAVERAMTFNGGAAGSVGAGALAPGYSWAFVDGRTRDASYYLCVSNPNPAPATVTVDFVFVGRRPPRCDFSRERGHRRSQVNPGLIRANKNSAGRRRRLWYDSGYDNY
ncbi:peptidoglycan recognition protein family protein [Oscillochloris sp. ZM17-4]|uniref:peptidoglycan recognition protein family protein n=1 Tax=Oscillochloris sp. ZM17-4 TaxID=2866714 RepID=UPI001C73E0B1|nr:peptidoglycan recognition family protein [Oscillochloris sp. ZM17-4]MBX0328147.1 peptidoglycan recognition protein family protein [Oscillochloris sp. ZM17-4]